MSEHTYWLIVVGFLLVNSGLMMRSMDRLLDACIGRRFESVIIWLGIVLLHIGFGFAIGPGFMRFS